MSIATPEGLELELVLAGAGSRFVAGLIDLLLRGVVLIALIVVLDGMEVSDGFAVGIWSLSSFALLFGYDILFELAASGRTPGKRWTGLQVVMADGRAVGAGASVVRNLLRIVDSLPGVYLVGILLVALTTRHQRLGDIVAGTVVVRDRRDVSLAAPGRDRRTHPELATWDVSAITPEEEATVRRFVERRDVLDREARARLATDLATRLRPKVVVPEVRTSAEGFLEDLLDARSLRR